jgi:hypothetical protein
MTDRRRWLAAIVAAAGGDDPADTSRHDGDHVARPSGA